MNQTNGRINKSHLQWILPILIIALAITIYVVLKQSKPKAAARPTIEKVWSVQSISVTPGSHQPYLELYGKVAAPKSTSLTAAVTAFVSSVPASEGDSVEQGALLVQLDESDLQLQLRQREADLDAITAQIAAEKIRYQSDLKALENEKNLLRLSKNSVKRYQDLAKRNVSSQDQLDNARKSYEQQSLSLLQRQQAIQDHPNRLKQLEAQKMRASALLDTVKLDLQRSRITAPYSGRISRTNVAVGDRVRAGDPLLSLYSLDQLEIRAQLPNRILPQLRGNGNHLTAEAILDGERITLELDRIAAEVGATGAGIDAMFKLHQVNNYPEPGRTLALSLQLPKLNNTIAVPPTALYGLDRIYRINSDRLEAVTVTRLGDSIDADGNSLVLLQSDALNQGDQIITTQLPNAITGLKVKEAGNNE